MSRSYSRQGLLFTLIPSRRRIVTVKAAVQAGVIAWTD